MIRCWTSWPRRWPNGRRDSRERRSLVKLDADTLRLSATDLANHLACGHLTGLDRGVAEGRWKPPDWFRPEAALLRERGLEHERAYLAHLERQGRRDTRVGEEDGRRRALVVPGAAVFAGAEGFGAGAPVGGW